ncbi:MAG: alanine dehydrogenase [Chloroflexi bacterium]|jgi:alanine dehydrogenase|nr:MAG: alanine dehydrogenase [Chloroflexota bacterium]
MVLMLTNKDIDSLIDIGDTIEALEGAFGELGRGEATSRPRTLSYSPLGPDDYYLFSCMDSSLPGQGVHMIRMTSDHVLQTSHEGIPRRDKLGKAPGGKFCGLILMFSLETLEPLAIFQDALLNRLMVGATTALGTKYMARAGSTKMGLLGSGWLAHTQVTAHCAILPIETIKVYSPHKENREALCSNLQGQVDAKLIPVDTREEAMEDYDILATATNSYDPVFDGNLLKPGHHVAMAGAKSECDVATYERSAVVGAQATDLATFWHPPESAPLEKGWGQIWQPEWNHKLRTLGKMVAGIEKGRDSEEDITFFGGGPSHGLGIQYAAGVTAYRRAKEQGIGYEIPTELFLEDFHP